MFKEALDRYEPEIQKVIEWAKDTSLSECKSIRKRFSVEHSLTGLDAKT